MDMSNAQGAHKQELLEKVCVPTQSLLDKLGTMFACAGSSHSTQLERDTAILTFFRTLSGEENCDGDGDAEINSPRILTSDPDVLHHNEEPPIHPILPVEGTTTMCNAVKCCENNWAHFNLSEEVVRGGESEQTPSYPDIEKEAASRINWPEQNRFQWGDLIGDGLSGHKNCHREEDTPREWTPAEESGAEGVADGLTQPQCPHLLNGSANTHTRSTHNADDAAQDTPGEPEGGERRSQKDQAICTSLCGPMCRVLIPSFTRTEQETFELELHTAMVGSWPSDGCEDTDPNLTRMESTFKDVVLPAALKTKRNKEKTDGLSNATQEDGFEIITDVVEEEEEEDDIFSDDNDALMSGLTSDRCEPVSPESMEEPPGASSPSAFPSSGPLPGSTTTTTITTNRTTFLPSSPTDKPIQLPALFSGLRVLRKGVTGPEHDTVAQIKSPLRGSKKELVPEVEHNPGVGTKYKVQRRESLLDQISQLLNRRTSDGNGDESDSSTEPQPQGLRMERDETGRNAEEDAPRVTGGPREQTELKDTPKSPVSGAEAAFDAFKAFFTPKPLRKDPSERFDLEAVRRRIKSDKDVLRALFERSSNNMRESPSDIKSEADTSGDTEERTPGRLQAVWPPLKEEKVGLKYTEAEHQAALLQLKRECKEEEEILQEDHGRALSRLREEHEESMSRLGFAMAHLHTQLTRGEARRYRDLRDASVSTEDEVPRKVLRAASVQTDRETSAREGGCGGGSQHPMAHPKKLDLTSIGLNLPHLCDSLWNSLEQPSLVNSGEFEDLFAKVTQQAHRKPLSQAYQKKAKTRKIVKLLDSRRSQAVGIFISSLHLEMKDIKHAVLKVDNSLVDLETVEALYENRAQPEELQKIRNHYETSDQEQLKLLDKPEQFLYELSQIPDFAGRAQCIIFQSAFTDTIGSIRHKVQIVSSVCRALRERASVREVMALVLALGNHMNGGSRVRGQADGFGLEILPKLKDVKSRDNRMSLVDYVVFYYLHNVDQDAGTDRSVFPLPEPQDLFMAGQVKMDELNGELRRLGRDLAVCEKDVLKVSSGSLEEHRQPFQDKMEAFLLTARRDHEEASERLIFEELVGYFGLRPKAGEGMVSTAHVFLLWFEFCADFKSRLKEAQQSVRRITTDKKVEIRPVNPNSLKDRLRQRDATRSAH
ncbi:hypothetical protein NHX12_025853 [Muraenolepis orangiensis]|uniref:FH2 domain-containing protein n=1 Tax=Muraenolepis orangiensis TaxID=630683 RepID=A0A9Q0EL39_9TELE|nr:hypothetical protein NHX12_025853 [Muraenolepis orangiensis]